MLKFLRTFQAMSTHKQQYKQPLFHQVIMPDSPTLDFQNQLSKLLQTSYLSPYLPSSTLQQTKLQGSFSGPYQVISLPTYSYQFKQNINVHWMMRTGSPITFLQLNAFKAVFGSYEQAEKRNFKTEIMGVETQVYEAEGNLKNVNVLGQDFLRNGGLELIVDYSNKEKSWRLVKSQNKS